MDARRVRTVLATLAALAGALPSAAALSQDYPARPVRIITGAAGNFHDIVARRLALALAETWRQPVVVENRGGAGAILAATAGA